MADEKRVAGYDDPVQEPEELILKTFEYRMPFNYRNVTVNREYKGGEVHGVELFPIYTNTKKFGLPPDFIEVEEQNPIVRVAVIGSACTPPGWIQIEADPVEGFRREKESPEVMPVRFRADNLWGKALQVRYLEGTRQQPDRPRLWSGALSRLDSWRPKSQADQSRAPSCGNELRDLRDSAIRPRPDYGRRPDPRVDGGQLSRRCALFIPHDSNYGLRQSIVRFRNQKSALTCRRLEADRGQ